jgi:NAD(P)-dependent dehydrogenase (short-subunit alcohol dehydrogenase family)
VLNRQFHRGATDVASSVTEPVQGLRVDEPDGGTQVVGTDLKVADLSSQAQVWQLASEVRTRHTRLDVLINNAAAVNAERRVTSDGS